MTTEEITREARKLAAKEKMRGKDKRLFMRACRKVAEEQGKTKDCG